MIDLKFSELERNMMEANAKFIGMNLNEWAILMTPYAHKEFIGSPEDLEGVKLVFTSQFRKI